MDVVDFPALVREFKGSRRKGHPETYRMLHSIGKNFYISYGANLQPIDLDRAIFCYELSAKLTPDTDLVTMVNSVRGPHPSKASRLSHLADALLLRFEKKNDISDLDSCIASYRTAVDLSPNDHKDKAKRLSSLGSVLEWRFKHFGDSLDLDSSIAYYQLAVDATQPDDDQKAGRLSNLGSALGLRFARLGKISDLQSSIPFHQKALDLTPDGHPSKPKRLSNLGEALKARYDNFGRDLDLESSIRFFQAAAGAIANDNSRRALYLSNLGNALHARFQRRGNVADIDAAINSHTKAGELTPDSHPGKPSSFSNLGNAYESRFGRLGNTQDLELSVTCHGMAVDLTSDDYPQKAVYLCNLGNALKTRFGRLGDIKDLESSIARYREAVDLAQNDHPDKPSLFANLGGALELRFKQLGESSDIEESIFYKQIAAEQTSDKHPSKAKHFSNLGNALESRFTRRGNLADLESAVGFHRKAVGLTPDDFPIKVEFLCNLGIALVSRFKRIGKIVDLEESIKTQRRAVELAPDDHPDKSTCLSSLGIALQSRFERLGHLEDLAESIAMHEKAVELVPDDHPKKPSHLHNLGLALFLRFERLRNEQDLRKALDAFSIAAQSRSGPPVIKFRAARQWGRRSQETNNKEEILLAYGHAVGLIPVVAWMGLAMEGRHRELEDAGDLVRRAAAAAVRYGEPNLALEWLEQGRSVVWGQTLQLRTPLEHLQEHDPLLAERLTAISRALEAGADDKSEDGQQFRALALEWDNVLSEVRDLEGFENFMRPKKAAQLLSAATVAPIIVVNTHETGCDALILRPHAGAVSRVSLEFTSEKAQELFDDLVKVHARQYEARSAERGGRGFQFVGGGRVSPDTTMKNLLGMLWSDIVNPVLKHLGISVSRDNQVVFTQLLTMLNSHARTLTKIYHELSGARLDFSPSYPFTQRGSMTPRSWERRSLTLLCHPTPRQFRHCYEPLRLLKPAQRSWLWHKQIAQANRISQVPSARLSCWPVERRIIRSNSSKSKMRQEV